MKSWTYWIELICEALLQVVIAVALGVACFIGLMALAGSAYAHPTDVSPHAHQLVSYFVKPATETEPAETKQTTCSSSAIGRSTLITAKHCVQMPGYKLAGVSVDGRLAGVWTVEHSQGDVSIVVLAQLVQNGQTSTVIHAPVVFERWATVRPRSLSVGEAVEYAGWAGRKSVQYRRGYVSGLEIAFLGGWAWLLDVNGGQGDSGSGVFNSRGELVAVISYVVTGEVRARFMGAYEPIFTDEQLAVVE